MPTVPLHPRRIEAERRAVARINAALQSEAVGQTPPAKVVGHEGVYLLIVDGMSMGDDITATVISESAAHYLALTKGDESNVEQREVDVSPGGDDDN
jgi:hypothetical protein